MNQRIQALFFITRCLVDDSRPESIETLRTEILSGQLSWAIMVSLANGQLVTPALWVALKQKGLTGDLDGDLRDYLDELHRLNVIRNTHLQAQLLEAVQQLNSINVSPVLLKGALHLVSDMYGDPGARIMSDIDLLVPGEDTQRCMAALQALGYRTNEEKLDDYPERHHHCPPLSRPADYADIEIHRKLMGGYADILSAETVMTQAVPLIVQGLSMKVLSPTHRAFHNILHSQLVDRNYHAGILPLRSMYEIVTENRACHGTIDWSMIHAAMKRQHRGRVLRTYLYQAYRLFDFPLPADFRKTPDCWLYYWRCVAELGWQQIEAMGQRMKRYSADNIRHAYGCNDGWLPVNIARLKQVRRRLSTLLPAVKQR
jgi:hypothetical protein